MYEKLPKFYNLPKWVNFGNLGIKESSAQITQLYQPKDLVLIV
ncbi:hypothetical protein [Nostoc spongiaeforme]|nr:hypothetical protein [Nostoc spongiaeforme]